MSRILLMMLATLAMLATGCQPLDVPVEEAEAAAMKHQSAPEVVKVTHRGEPAFDAYGYWGPESLLEMVATSDVIVRGRFISVTPVGVRTIGREGYVAALEITFEVLEHLKGGRSGRTIKGVAIGFDRFNGEYDYLADTEQDAAQKADVLLGYRDTRWDSREAIIMLSEVAERDYLYLGGIGPGSFKFTVADAERRAWMPSTALVSPSSSSNPQDRVEQFFFTGEPTTALAKSGPSIEGPGIGPVDAEPNVSLSALKLLIREVDNEVRASGEDPQAYARCLALTEWFNRTGQDPILTLESGIIGSGLPAGTRAVTHQTLIDINLKHDGATAPPFYHDPDHRWYEGQHGHLFLPEYPGYSKTTRPLPAGEYRAYGMVRLHGMVICEGDPSVIRNAWNIVVTVTAPAGTVAEAFVDPVAQGQAVSANTTIGTFSYQGNTLRADLSVATASNQTIDFIELDGDTRLSLAVSAARNANGVLSWTVNKRPWESGDLLMARVSAPAPG